MKNERDVKAQCKRIIRNHGGWYTMPIQTGYGIQGVPDILACVNGQFLGIECKFGYNKPTALQTRQLRQIAQAGGRAVIIHENNLDVLQALCQDAVDQSEKGGDGE